MDKWNHLKTASNGQMKSLLGQLGHEYTHEEFQRLVYKFTGLVVANIRPGYISVHAPVNEMKLCPSKIYKGNYWGIAGLFVRKPIFEIKSNLHYNWALLKRVLREIKRRHDDAEGKEDLRSTA